MPIERWGTLSVNDHLNTQALIADLLLYDRLVFPVFSGEGERTRWRKEGWDPEAQESLIQELGAEVVVRAEWDEWAREHYKDLRKMGKQIARDPFQDTRELLRDRTVFPHLSEVRAIAAYYDEDEGRRDLGLTTVQPDGIGLGKLAFVVGQQLLVPLINPKASSHDLLLRARDLSRDQRYRDQRLEFYLWQEKTVDAIVRERRTVKSEVDDLKKQADALDHWVKQYFSKHKNR